MDLELDPDPELTPQELWWDIDGIGAWAGVDPPFRSESYNPNMDLDLELTPTMR